MKTLLAICLATLLLPSIKAIAISHVCSVYVADAGKYGANFFGLLTQEEAYYWVRVKQEFILANAFNARDYLDYDFEWRQFPNADRSYTYWAPSRAFNPTTPLLTPEVVRDLQQGASMLSVGCGFGFLERLLIEQLKVSAENIVSTDRQLTQRYLPQGVEFHRFNFFRRWPDFGRKFDYVVFPDSIFFPLLSDRIPLDRATEHRVNVLMGVIKKALLVLKRPGQIRMLDLDAEYISELQRRPLFQRDGISFRGINDRLAVIELAQAP